MSRRMRDLPQRRSVRIVRTGDTHRRAKGATYVMGRYLAPT
ncbi:hypothetical protein [Idiomarina sp.]